MKLSTFLATSALAVVVIVATPAVIAANATTNSTTDTGTQAADIAKPQKPEASREQKMGAVAKADPSAQGKPAPKKNPWTDYSRHFHPRDGK